MFYLTANFSLLLSSKNAISVAGVKLILFASLLISVITSMM